MAGFDPTRRENAYRRIFALVLGQKNQLWWDLPANESFLLLRHIYGLDATQFKQTLDELITLLDVGHKLNVMVRELSLGERMKMELIAALLHRPRVLFLDEPTIGLDVVSQKAVRAVPARLQPPASHHHPAHQPLHGRHQGAVRARDRDPQGPQDPRRRHRPAAMPPAAARRSSSSGRPTAATFGGDRSARRDAAAGRTDDGGYEMHVPSDQAVAVSQQILAAGPVADITIEDVPLEDIIAELFGKQA